MPAGSVSATGEAGNGQRRVNRVGKGIMRWTLRHALRSTSGRATRAARRQRLGGFEHSRLSLSGSHREPRFDRDTAELVGRRMPLQNRIRSILFGQGLHGARHRGGWLNRCVTPDTITSASPAC
jgi:hypothetical protein